MDPKSVSKSSSEKVVKKGVLDEKEVFLPEERLPDQYSHAWQDKIGRKLRSTNEYVRLFLAEMLGTFILIVIGVGCVAQAVLNRNFRQNYVMIDLGWGFAVMFGVYACGGASHGHINPAVTVCFAFFGRLKWRYVPAYLAGQYVGAFLGSVAVYIIYYSELNRFDNGVRQGPYTPGTNASTASIFATYPQHDGIPTWQGFLDQVFATGLLTLLAMAIIDDRNMEVPKGLKPMALGFMVAALVTAYESNCGAALNPARDFSPRLFTAIAGWGGEVFSFRNYDWFWVPILGPHIGAILGGWLYNICVGLHLPPATKYVVAPNNKI